MSRIEEHMSRYVVTVSPDQTLEVAAQMMVERSVGSAIILNNGAIEGIVTERDVLRSVARGLVPWNTKVVDCMTPKPLTVSPSDLAEEAVRTMVNGGFRHLPVVEKGNLVGIVSLRDLMGWRPPPVPSEEVSTIS
ncbi:MAG: CBS domain-containing protein [Actinomycetota bacterium]